MGSAVELPSFSARYVGKAAYHARPGVSRMGITARIMLVVAAVLLVVGGVLATQHVRDQGYDCGTAFAVNDANLGRSEATVFGDSGNKGDKGSVIDCASGIRNQRAIAGAFGLVAVALATAALLMSANLPAPGPRRERDALRLNG
jgi:hypothetical protein